MRVVRSRHVWPAGLALAVVLGAPLTRGTSFAAPPSAPRWSVVLTTAPHSPQDVWFTSTGNNADGWRGGGCLCIGPLAQGLGPGDHATILIDVVDGGVFGIDGTPVPPGIYVAPGATFDPDEPTGPGAELPDREFEMKIGRTFFVIVDAEVVESNVAGLPTGATFRSMFTFDFDPARLGRTENLSVNWIDFGFGFFPFLNEGVLMTNVRRLP